MRDLSMPDVSATMIELLVALLATTVAEPNNWWRVPVVTAASDRAVILAGLPRQPLLTER